MRRPDSLSRPRRPDPSTGSIRHAQPGPRRPRREHDAAPQPAAHAALSRDDLPARRPIISLLLVVRVFGGTLGAGLGGDRSACLAHVVPGILPMTVAGGGTGTACAAATSATAPPMSDRTHPPAG